jgi:hypothetical protein
MITRTNLLTIISVILFGCASPPYIPPQRPDAAKLTFTNKTDHEVVLHGFENGEDCSGGTLSFNNRHELGPRENITISVTPEEQFSFLFFLVNQPRGYSCLMPATFTPKKGMEYSSAFELMSLRCDDDSIDPDSRNEITPTTRSLGSFRYLTSNNSIWEDVEDPLERRACGQEWATSTNTRLDLVFPLCYVSITKIENGDVVREPSFTLRTQKRGWMPTDTSCQ